MISAPAPRGCYWADPGRILAGPYPSIPDAAIPGYVSDVEHLMQLGIRAFLNLHGEPYDDAARTAAETRGMKILSYCIPFEDFAAPPEAKMTEALNLLLRIVQRDVPVYVHCIAGCGRTGMLIGCYLIATGKATPENFVQQIAMRRNAAGLYGNSPDTAPQVCFVQRFGAAWLREHPIARSEN